MTLKSMIFFLFMTPIFAVVLLVSATYAMFALQYHRAQERENAAERAGVMAMEIDRLMLWDDRVAIRRALDGLMTNETVVYAFVEKGGKPYVTTFAEGVPRALLTGKLPMAGLIENRSFRDESGDLLYDVVSKIGSYDAALHVGLSRLSIDRGIRSEFLAFFALAIAALTAGCILAGFVARWTTREVDRMTVSRDYLGAIIDGLPDVVMVVEPDHRVLLANRLARSMGNGKGGEAGILHCFNVSHGRTIKCGGESYICPVEQVVRKGEAVTVEHLHHGVEGHEIPYEIVAAPIFDDKRKVARVILSARDLTERHTLEAQLRQAQKMEAVGQLAGGIAHDFNNLLQAIRGYTELLLEEFSSTDVRREHLKEVDNAAKRAADLTRQLLAFSRRQVLRLADLDLNDMIAGVVKMLRRVIGEHIELCVIPGHDIGTVRADPGQIEQVLMNLCINARDAMPRGGQLLIKTENVLINSEYVRTHSDSREGRYVLLSVTDTGHGMDVETLSQIFEPFFTTKGVGQGTGLGLATVYGIVKQHGGMIQVYSEVGKGTTFKIYFACAERQVTAVTETPEGPVSGGTETILLAEDSESVRKLAQAVLEKAGYRVFTAEDGNAALRLFEAHSGSIALLLLDVVMPGLDGRAVYERLREKKPEIRVLFASGYSANSIHTNFILDEGMYLIEKPYRSEVLLRKVRQVLDTAPGEIVQTPHAQA